jgi:copper resistance protein B
MSAAQLPRAPVLALALCVGLSARLDAQNGPASVTPSDPHANHAPANPPEKPAATTANLPDFIPPITEGQRKAAFPDVAGHAVHDRAVHSLVLVDQAEWRANGNSSQITLDTKGWVGTDRDRLWFRAEGDRDAGRVGDAEVHALYGRQISRWWDLVGGIRQDFRPGPAQTWAAVGIHGLAPYWFDVEATAYLGAEGRVQARIEVEYELLLTNYWILQPAIKANVFGKGDPERAVGRGLGTTEMGFRLRYEHKREVAPYVGVVWNRKWGTIAELADTRDGKRDVARLIAGLRLLF